ncbi:MAG: sensor histidine kinase [Rhizobiales bacterium]|nr:sensor histidine kinase [Hyphomicrobiales bacterium]
MRQITAAVLQSLSPTADLKDVDLHYEGPAVQLFVTGDPLLVEAALRNMLDNAIKYSPMDAEVRVTLGRAEGKARIAICDQGRGLGGASLADLQGRFRRGGNVADIVGSGLGLTIVAEVANAMGGGFDLQEHKEGGTCATLTLPVG